jgi:glycosyltransferase involved in cell wall biosynthesis
MGSCAPARARGASPMAAERPSVCYFVAGHNLLTSAGPTRNVLSLARAMSEWADVTVAFRRVLEPVEGEPFKVLEIDPRPAGGKLAIDDAAVRGVGYLEFADYLGLVRRFADERLTQFDVVLEKSWLLTGYVTARCLSRGVQSVPIVNLVPLVNRPLANPAKAARNWVARGISGRYLRQAPAIIAETEDLKSAMTRHWRIRPERIDVVGLGVDRNLFEPRDQAPARRQLGIPEDRTILLYVGALDRAHDLVPVIEAITRVHDPSLQLHIVGDGAYGDELRRRAKGTGAVVFHGRVPHESVPAFIAAADLCVAPYDPSLFPRGQVGYATLKLREYLAAGRPVATTPTGHLPSMIRNRVTGFLVENDVLAWAQFLQRGLPGRQTLRFMGQAASAKVLESWEDTARSYWRVCERTMGRTGEPAAV